MVQAKGFLKRHSVSISILLMYAFTWPIYLSGSGLLPIRFPAAIYSFANAGFVLAALLMTSLTDGIAAVGGLLKRFLIWRVGWSWYLALLLIPAIDIIGILIHAVMTGTVPDFSSPPAIRYFGLSAGAVFYGLANIVIGGILNMEEIGWRGYALPHLQARYTALFAALVIGLPWALWHIPLFLAGSNPTAFAWYIVGVIAKSVLITWVYNGTGGSLLVVTLYHGLWNTVGGYLPMTMVASEADIGTFAVIILVEIAAAAIIVLATGATHLSRTRQRQMQVSA